MVAAHEYRDFQDKTARKRGLKGQGSEEAAGWNRSELCSRRLSIAFLPFPSRADGSCHPVSVPAWLIPAGRVGGLLDSHSQPSSLSPHKPGPGPAELLVSVLGGVSGFQDG